MNLILSTLGFLIFFALTMACAGVLLVRVLSTKVLTWLFVITVVMTTYFGRSVYLQTNELIEKFSPMNLIKSTDLFSKFAEN